MTTRPPASPRWLVLLAVLALVGALTPLSAGRFSVDGVVAKPATA